MNDGLTASDALLLSKSQQQDGGLFGNGSGGGLWAFLIFAMIFGGGNLFGTKTGAAAVEQGISNDFLFNNLSRGQQLGFDQISSAMNHGFSDVTNSISHLETTVDNGFATTQNSVNNGFYNINTTLLNGFCGLTNTVNQGFNAVNTGILQSQYNTERALCAGFTGTTAGITDLGWKMQQCCCETNRNLDSIKYENAKNTCDIITSGNANTQRMIDWLTQEKICSLNAELQTAQGALSNAAQTQTILTNLGKYVPYSSCPLQNCGGC